MKTTKISFITGLIALIFTTACEKNNQSFSILAASENFAQKNVELQRKVDILWVIDNSGSMSTSQTNLTNNFSAFISRFQSLNYDFKMAVQTTDAYINTAAGMNSIKNDGTSRNRFRKVTDNGQDIYYLAPTTNNLNTNFVNLAMQGINGSGDERAFSSLLESFSFADNSDFRRPGAFLAIILVSDEDDFSSINFNNPNLGNNYAAPGLLPVTQMKSQLDSLIGNDSYSVNAITIKDQTCLNTLNQEFSGRRIGQRYMDLVSLTKGVSQSLCDNFGQTLNVITNSIVSLTSNFKLDREPIISTISVKVNGAQVFQDSVNGWTYDPATMVLKFNGNSIPPAGALIQINYDPIKAKS